MQKSDLQPKYLFIAPPTEADLEKRLRGRGTETDDKIRVRLNNAKKELEFGRTGVCVCVCVCVHVSLYHRLLALALTHTNPHLSKHYLNTTHHTKQTAQTEGNFDALIVNDDVDVCFGRLVETLKGWFPDLSLE